MTPRDLDRAPGASSTDPFSRLGQWSGPDPTTSQLGKKDIAELPCPAMIKEKDVDTMLGYAGATVEKWFWIGVRGTIRILKKHKPVVHEAVKDLRAVTEFLDEKLD